MGTRHHNHDAVVNGGDILSSEQDIAWLMATHLKGMSVKPFKSFVIIGNEDSPDAIYLYEMENPLAEDSRQIINFGEVTA